ncbi:reverse transcriptase domain-containing protein [Tanacetum coccineum]
MGKGSQTKGHPELLFGDSNLLSIFRRGRRNGRTNDHRSLNRRALRLPDIRGRRSVLRGSIRTLLHQAPARNKKPDYPSYHITHRIQWRNHLAARPDIPTSKDSRVISMICAMISGPSTQHPVTSQVLEEKIKMAIHPEYPEQTIAIGSTLTKKGRKELCALLRQNLDVFAWKPADMTGVPWHIAEHRLNVREGCLPIKQKKRGQAPERNKAIQEEVENLVDAGIMKEVHYHSWLSNPVIVKKHDGSWQMCVDFKDLNKACPKDGYPLPEIDWKEGMFLGYKVNADGLKVCPDKADAVLSLPSPGCLKDVQKLNGKLANSGSRSSLQTDEETHRGAPNVDRTKGKEELIMYLAAAKEAISAVLMTEREGKQMPVYFVSRALRGPEINYTPMEKLVLALLSVSRRLKRYFQAHTIVVITDQPIKQLLSNSEITGRMLKWKFELEGYDIQYRPKISIKVQILTDFIVKRPEEESSDKLMAELEEPPEP